MLKIPSFKNQFPPMKQSHELEKKTFFYIPNTQLFTNMYINL